MWLAPGDNCDCVQRRNFIAVLPEVPRRAAQQMSDALAQVAVISRGHHRYLSGDAPQFVSSALNSLASSATPGGAGPPSVFLL